MYCRNCGRSLDDRAVVCVNCGMRPHEGISFCQNCSKETQAGTTVCTGCGLPVRRAPVVAPGTAVPGADKKLAAALCGILLGALGIHKFVLGYTTAGVIMLLVTILTCGLGGAVMGVIGLIEGIIYLTKSDEEFVRTYIDQKKEWF